MKRDKEYNKGKPIDTRAYRHLYKRGELPPNYPMPAIRYGTMLLNWHGEHRFVVVYANEWGGYATLITDKYVK